MATKTDLDRPFDIEARRLRPLAPARVLCDGLLAGAIGAVVSGAPSTLHALATGNDPMEATLAAGTIVLPHEQRNSRLLPAGAVAHASISLLWGIVLAACLPRRRPIRAGAVAGLAIAAVDLGVIGRRLPRIRSLASAPQLADHVLYGAAVGTVLAIRQAHRQAEEIVAAAPRHG
jgi:hypothetical protein